MSSTKNPLGLSREAPATSLWVAVALTALATFMANANASDLPPALPNLLTVFHGGPTDLIWLPLAYLVPFAAVLPLVGRLTDAWGHRPVFLWGTAIFTVFAAASSLSTSLPVLLVWRALDGIGGAMLLPSIGFLVMRAGEGKTEMPLTIWRVALLTGTVGGPVLGGLLDGWGGWTALFWPFAAVGLVVFIWGAWALHEPTLAGRDRRMDWLGGVAALLGLSAFVVALSMAGMKTMGPLAGQTFSMRGSLGLALLAILAVLVWAVVTVIWTQRTRPRPVLDFKLLQHPRFVLGNVGTLLICVGMFSVMMFIPLFLQYQMHETVVQASLALLPATLASIVFGIWGGALAARHGDQKIWVAGFLAMTIGFGLMGFIRPSTPLLYILLAESIVGVGMGLPIGPTANVALGSIPAAQTGEASGIFNLFHNMGRPLGLGTLGALLVIASVASYQIIFGVTAVVMLVGAFVATGVGQQRKTGSGVPAHRA